MNWLLSQGLLDHDEDHDDNELQSVLEQSLQEAPLFNRENNHDPSSIKMSIETYDKLKHINTCCPITFEDFIDGETVIAILECNHCFKEEFIKRWLVEKPECPVCRFKLNYKEKPTVEEDTAYFLNSIHILANMRNYNTRTTHATHANDNDSNGDVDADVETLSETDSENYDPNADYLEDFMLI